MNRYLLFDAGCDTCSGTAKQIQDEAGETLTVRSIAEPEIQQYLDKALPEGWDWEPMILEVSEDDKDIQVHSGLLMRFRLIQLLGINKALNVASVVYKSIRPAMDLQSRRTFLRQTGSVAAGLAVVGLNPLKAQTQYVINTPSGDITSRNLSGTELSDAVSNAKDAASYSKFTTDLDGRGYSERQGHATATEVSAPNKQSGLMVTIPFTTANGGNAQIKVYKHGSDVRVGMGVMVTQNGTLSSVKVYEVVSDTVRHTSTLSIRDGVIVEVPAGQSSPAEDSNSSLSDFMPDDVEVNSCWLCQLICRALNGINCSIGSFFACNLICLQLAPICAIICAAIFWLICSAGGGHFKCNAICGPSNLGWCP